MRKHIIASLLTVLVAFIVIKTYASGMVELVPLEIGFVVVLMVLDAVSGEDVLVSSALNPLISAVLMILLYFAADWMELLTVLILLGFAQWGLYAKVKSLRKQGMSQSFMGSLVVNLATCLLIVVSLAYQFPK